MRHTKREGIEKMADDRATKTEQLTRCSNEKCRQLIYASDLKQNDGKCPYCAKQVWENCWTPWYKAFMETKSLNIDCPKLKERVVLTLTRPHPTSELTYPPFRLADCSSALECGLIKEKDETPDWSLCPLCESRFWS